MSSEPVSLQAVTSTCGAFRDVATIKNFEAFLDMPHARTYETPCIQRRRSGAVIAFHWRGDMRLPSVMPRVVTGRKQKSRQPGRRLGDCPVFFPNCKNRRLSRPAVSLLSALPSAVEKAQFLLFDV